MFLTKIISSFFLLLLLFSCGNESKNTFVNIDGMINDIRKTTGFDFDEILRKCDSVETVRTGFYDSLFISIVGYGTPEMLGSVANCPLVMQCEGVNREYISFEEIDGCARCMLEGFRDNIMLDSSPLDSLKISTKERLDYLSESLQPLSLSTLFEDVYDWYDFGYCNEKEYQFLSLYSYYLWTLLNHDPRID